MGLSCSTVIGAFCHMKGLTDCVTSCGMYIFSCTLSLFVYMSLNKQPLTLIAMLGSQLLLGYLVFNVFSPSVTDIIMFLMNTLASVLMPLDQLDKVLQTRDLSYCSYLMNTLSAISCILWGLYYLLAGTYQLVVPNIAGLICTIFLIPACLLGEKKISQEHYAVKMSEGFVTIVYRMPIRMIFG